MVLRNKKETDCPLELTLEIIGGKWKVVILHHLKDGEHHRFTELRLGIPRISSKVLAEHLKQLENDNLINREVFPEVPVRVEYSLTESGKTLIPILDAIRDWGVKYLLK